MLGEESVDIDWAGRKSGVLDLSKDEIAAWWAKKIKSSQDKYGLDSFEFDFG